MLGERLNLTNRLIIVMALACVVFGASVGYLYFKSQVVPATGDGEPTDGNLVGVIQRQWCSGLTHRGATPSL
jgi:hypothetical protein